MEMNSFSLTMFNNLFCKLFLGFWSFHNKLVGFLLHIIFTCLSSWLVWFLPCEQLCHNNMCPNYYYYTLNSLPLFWLAESVQWIFEISTRDVITADYTIIMSRTLKVTGYHVIQDCCAWFLRVIMPSLCTLCCFPSTHDFHFFHSMYYKTIIWFGFCDIQNNQGLGKCYQPQPSALIWLITWMCLLYNHRIKWKDTSQQIKWNINIMAENCGQTQEKSKTGMTGQNS